MSEAIAFDTHRFVKHLTENGFTEQQAEVLADEQVHLLNSNLATQADVAAIQRGYRPPSTKDIESLRQETKADIEILRQETKTSIAEVQRDIANIKSDLLKWMTGALIAQGGVVVALLKLLQG